MKRTLIVFLLVNLMLSACAPASAPMPTPVPSATPLPTATAVPTSTATPTSTPMATPTATLTATFSPIRSTPMTIMMHPSTDAFDAVGFLREFILILQENHIRVITYRNILEDPNITVREKGKIAIITIDDVFIGSRNGLNRTVQEMIDLLCEANYPAVLGVVTQGEPNSTSVALLRDLLEKGWEIATHTDTHPNLGMLSPLEVSLEITTSQDKIEYLFGHRPITLILPYGQRLNNTTAVKNAGIVWMVGIGGGEMYNVNDGVYYVGRQGPAGTPLKTFEILMRRFNP